ncbi:MAG: metallophosphoesterase [Armatimonadetes bacterium]|nr:metallophosphoesterase [Armatimonadota bacterium]MDW8121297.1 metallophosphoesterase [Armatimonadota bacterium]
MRVALMADTHDRLDTLEKAVALINDWKADYTLHAGDFVAPFVGKVLEKLQCPLIGVFGNNDGEKLGLKARLESFGARVTVQPAIVTIGEKKVVIVHEGEWVEALSQSGLYQLVLYGHTHQTDLRRLPNGCIVVNPGEVCGWLTGRCSIALWDVETMEVKFTEL